MIPRVLDHPVFPHVAVILGDPSLRDEVKPGGAFTNKEREDVRILKQALAKLKDYTFTYLDNHSTLFFDLDRLRPEFALNFCDNGFRNDPRLELHIPACLEMLGIPYSGAGPDCLSRAYDKNLVCMLANACGIPTPAEILFRGDWEELAQWNIFPAMVKPNAADNSKGITEKSVVRTKNALLEQVHFLIENLSCDEILIEEFLPGIEYRVTMVGNEGCFFYLPVFEWDYSALDPRYPSILTHESKYDHGDSPYVGAVVPRNSNLPPVTERALKERSEKIFSRLGCRDCAKLDFRTDKDGVIKLIEFNPNPSWEIDSYFDEQDLKNGWKYEDMLRLLIEAGQKRYRYGTSALKATA